MERPIAPLILDIFASVAQSQTAPRGPLLLSDRGGDTTPQPGPDTCGVYSRSGAFTAETHNSVTQT
jgi:hypothetical protein